VFGGAWTATTPTRVAASQPGLLQSVLKGVESGYRRKALDLVRQGHRRKTVAQTRMGSVATIVDEILGMGALLPTGTEKPTVGAAIEVRRRSWETRTWQQQ
jgi:hypothetical protein